jgi:histidine triad (HIT) family protein
MSSIFTKIINGEIPCYKIAENDLFFAFLDIHPLTKGHTLIVPKKETDYFFDIEEDDLAGLLPFAKEVAVKLKKAMQCERVGIAVIGFEVPHAHMHLVPMNVMGDIDFKQPKLKLSGEEFLQISEAIQKA